MISTLLVVSALLIGEPEPQVSLEDIQYLPDEKTVVTRWGDAQIAESQLKILLQISPSRTHLITPQITEAKRQQAFWGTCYYARTSFGSWQRCKATETEALKCYSDHCILYLNEIRKLVGDEDYFAHRW